MVTFGQSFPGLETNILIDNSCKLSNGHPTCCGLLNYTSPHRLGKFALCTEQRTYFPSPYELMQMKKAEYFDSIPDFKLRQRAIADYIQSEGDLNSSFIWLDRVKMRMQNLAEIEVKSDYEYLSRFNVTRTCLHGKDVSWIEWIEPLSLHARNPFSLLHFEGIRKELVATHPQFAEKILQAGVINTDHLLLAKYNQNSNHRHGHLQNFLFDAGTSTFQSSLWWFTCMYLQQNVSFDQIFGWEYTLLEPTAFWDEVPKNLREKYHFYNTKMSADISHGNSPLRMIERIATEQDFVSFKLDIDTPEVEIPTVLSILREKKMHKLIDEFFFEFHFRCEIMMYLGWGENMPKQHEGLNLNRWGAMTLFQQLRILGIRSHFWP